MYKRLERMIGNRIDSAVDRAIARHADTYARANSGTRGNVTADRIARKINMESRALYRQIASYIDLREKLGHQHPIPPLRGFAISPDLALHLIMTLDALRPKKILDIGSGFSTVIFAIYCAEHGATLVSIDHDQKYADKTKALTEKWGVGDAADIICCPMTDYDVNGETIKYYSREQIEKRQGAYDLVFVDGPPQSFGDTVRGGLLEVLPDLLAPRCRIIMDDYYRAGEQEVVRRWRSNGDVELVCTDKTLEKYAAHLEVLP